MLINTLRFLVPDAEMVVRGEPTNANEYELNVDWLDARTQPTWAEIQSAKTAADKHYSTEQAKHDRHNAFTVESDPLYFGWQRGENTEQAWLDKVAEIRARYPYPA